MSEDTQLTEKVNEDLLDERNRVTVMLLEGDNIRNQYEIAVELDNPFEFDATRFLPNQKPMSLPRFFSIASELIKDAQKREGVKNDKIIRLIEEYPPEPFEGYGDEIIVSRVLKREPGLMNTKGTSRPHRKGTYAYDLVSPNHPNKVIVIESRPIDHLIEFSCWGKSNKLANARALWLEKLFVNHAWAFEYQGCERFHWKNRGPDTYMTTGGQRIFYRPVNFFVRFREFEVKAHPQIRKIIMESSPVF